MHSSVNNDIYEMAAGKVLEFANALESNLMYGHDVKVDAAMPMYIKQVLAHRALLLKPVANDHVDPLDQLASSLNQITGIPTDTIMEIAKIPFKKIKS